MGKILIIDKNPDFRQAIKTALVNAASDNIEFTNYQIIEAANYVIMENILINNYINLIICGINGFSDFFYRMYDLGLIYDNNIKQIPLILITETPEAINRFIEGFPIYLTDFVSNITFLQNTWEKQALLSTIESILLRNKLNQDFINKPQPDDVVLGGKNTFPTNSLVLGGIEGVKNRLNSPDIDTKIAALQEALNYGEAGLELVINALKQSDIEIRNQAYSLLRSRPEPTVQKILREILKQDKEYKHYRFLKYISNVKNQNITDNSKDKYYKILLIDDSAVIWKVIKDMLSPSKIDFLTAKDGKEGLELIRQEGTNLNLIILDFLLPVVSGWRVFLSIQTDNELKNIPLLIISGRREEVLDKIPLPFENFEFLEKPFDQNQLIEAIKSAIIKKFSIKN